MFEFFGTFYRYFIDDDGDICSEEREFSCFANDIEEAEKIDEKYQYMYREATVFTHKIDHSTNEEILL